MAEDSAEIIENITQQNCQSVQCHRSPFSVILCIPHGQRQNRHVGFQKDNGAELKNQAITKLNRLIEDGRQNAGAVIEHVMQNQPQDFIVKANALQFSGTGGLRMALGDKSEFGIHRFALGQIAEIATVPTRFVDSLAGDEWGRALIAYNLNEIFRHRNAKRHLVRTVNEQVRGFLSSSYRRLDSRPIVEAFAKGVMKLGALPYKGVITDTRVCIQAIVPDIYEPIPGEIVAFVISLENSDFGNGALSLRVGVVRIFCDNLACFEENLRQIHLGKRLDENILFSQRTYELDTKTTVSALSDIIDAQLNRDGIQRRMELVAANATKSVDVQSAQKMLKDALGIGEAQKVIDAYKSADIEMLPAGNNAWRFSNAISWIGGQESDGDKKLDLFKLAGRVLVPGKGGKVPFAEAEVVETALAA